MINFRLFPVSHAIKFFDKKKKKKHKIIQKKQKIQKSIKIQKIQKYNKQQKLSFSIGVASVFDFIMKKLTI
jgi:hypothetical protein